MNLEKFQINASNHNNVAPLVNEKYIDDVISKINWFAVFPNYLDIQSNAIKYAKIARQEVQNRKNGDITSEATMRKKVDALFWHGILGYSSIGNHFNIIGEKTSNISEKRADFILGKYAKGDDTKKSQDLNTKGVVEIEDSSYNFDTTDLKDGVIQAFNYAPLYRWNHDVPRYVIATNFILFRLYYGDINHAESFDLTKLYNEHELKRLLLFMSPRFFLTDNNKVQQKVNTAKSHQIDNANDPDKEAKAVYDKITAILKFERGFNFRNDRVGYSFNLLYLNDLQLLTNICDHIDVFGGKKLSVNKELTNWKLGCPYLPTLEQKTDQLKQRFNDLKDQIDEYCRESGNLEPIYELAQDPVNGTGALRQARELARPANNYFNLYQSYSDGLTKLRNACQNTDHQCSIIVAFNQYGASVFDLTIDGFISWVTKPASLDKMKKCWRVINSNPKKIKLNKLILKYTSADKAHKLAIRARIFKLMGFDNSHEKPAPKKSNENNAYKVCPNCGTKCPKSYNFCIKCGHKF